MRKFVLMSLMLFVLVLISLSFVSVVSAGFTKGNLLEDIETQYSPGDSISGWINISLQNEPADSRISSNFKGNATIFDLIYGNYTCSPASCENKYTSTNGQSNKSFSLAYNGEKLISFLAQGSVSSITDFSFNVYANNNPTCINPLKIDFILGDYEENLITWKSDKLTDDFSCTYGSGTGCFNPSSNMSSVEIDNSLPYCEKINLLENKKFHIGAWVKKNANATAWSSGLLKMYLYDLSGSELANCNLPQPSSGEVSCEVTLDEWSTQIQEYYVCIKATSSIHGYETKLESDDNPCGFFNFPGQETEYHDYYLFAKSPKFANIGSFVINQNELEKTGYSGQLTEDLFYYISDTYGSCSGGCSIPVRFKAYQGTNMQVSSANLRYSTGSGPSTSNLIYDSTVEKAKINSGFLKLNLNLANIKVPTTSGAHSFELFLEGSKILEKDIYVSSAVTINQIVPTSVAAAVPTEFTALVSGGNITQYTWNFGDGTAVQTTTTNKVSHTYLRTGSFLLQLTAKKSAGVSASKSFSINVGSAKNMANETLKKYRTRLNNLTSQISGVSGWYKSKLEAGAGLDDIDSQLDALETKYSFALSDQDYINVMANLTIFKVPYSLKITDSSSGSYIPDLEGIDPSYLTEASSEEIENPSQYNGAIFNWMYNNIEMQLERNVYSLEYDDKTEAIATVFVLKINPKQNFERDSYLIIDKSYDDLIFKENYMEKSAGQATSVRFSSLKENQEKTFEFLVEEEIEVLGLPIYISPEFSQLPEIVTSVEACNTNGECEKDAGENWKNCRADCKPWGWFIFWMIILLVLAFATYIGLQEWYKKYYEGRLFNNRNELYNLTFFMSNAINQKMGKEEIYSRLLKSRWKKEQINYAWNKYYGLKTGMWEIPVFKYFENKKVREEIQKRRQSGQVNKNMPGFRY